MFQELKAAMADTDDNIAKDRRDAAMIRCHILVVCHSAMPTGTCLLAHLLLGLDHQQ